MRQSVTAAGEAARTIRGVGEIKGAHVTPRQNNSGVCLVAAVGARERVSACARRSVLRADVVVLFACFCEREKERKLLKC